MSNLLRFGLGLVFISGCGGEAELADPDASQPFAIQFGGRLNQLDGLVGVGDCMEVDVGGAPITPAHTWAMCPTSVRRSGAIAWSHSFVGVGGVSGGGPSLAVNTEGDVVVTGTATAAVDFGGGALEPPEADYLRTVVVSFDASGAHRWSRALASGTGIGVDTDPAGNIVLLSTKWDGFEDGLSLVGLDRNGAERWSRFFPGTGVACRDSSCGSQVAVDAAGNAYFFGTINEGPVDLGNGPLDAPLDNGVSTFFVASLGPQGEPRWSYVLQPSAPEQTVAPRLALTSIAVDADGSVVLGGGLAGTIDFGGGPMTSLTRYEVSGGGYSILSTEPVLVSLDTAGGFRWARRFGPATETPVDSGGDALVSAVTRDGSGNIFVAGVNAAAPVVDFGAGPTTCGGGFAASFTPAGEHRWSTCFANTTATAIASDGAGGYLLAGDLWDHADFGPVQLTPTEGLGGYLVGLVEP